MKLTRAQKELLVEVSNGDDRCTPSYPPAARLVDLGLCVWASEYRLAMTDAGRAALQEQTNG